MMMKVTVLAFGIARELTGTSQTELDLPEGATAAAVRAALEARYEQLKKLSTYALAVNSMYAQPDTGVKDGDEIAIIPPVSGG